MGVFREKKGQVTIFIIIAVILVGVAVMLYLLTFGGKPTTTAGFDTKNPSGFIQTCLEDKIEDTVETLSLRGGSIEPEFYFTYNNINIAYLCYINEARKQCIVQQPLLKQHIESEIKNEIQEEVTSCFNQLEEKYENKNYDVQPETGLTKVELLPKRVVVTFDYALTISKTETERYDSFSVVLNNNIYELLTIVKSMVEMEVLDGEADPRVYGFYYDDLMVDKNLRDDGTNIYVVTDTNTGNKFQFASRSLVSLPGY